MRARTRPGVVFADRVSSLFITAGGVGTILAVALIFVFLVQVAAPLFGRGEISGARVLPVGARDAVAGDRVLHLGIDEYECLAWTLHGDGRVDVQGLDPWEPRVTLHPFGDAAPTAWAFSPGERQAAFAFADGTLRIAEFGFETRFLTGAEEPAALADLEVGETRAFGDAGAVVERTPAGQLRVQQFHVRVEDAFRPKGGKPVLALDLSIVDRGGQQEPILVTLDTAGAIRVLRTRKKKNLLTGKVRTKVTSAKLPFDGPGDGAPFPDRLLLSSLGDVVYAIWDDGRLLRFARDALTGAWGLAETRDLVDAVDGRITACVFLVGKSSLVVGDSGGGVNVWFRARVKDGAPAGTADGFRLVRAHALFAGGAAPTAFAPSDRSKLLAVGFEDGRVETVFVTNENAVAATRADGGPIVALAMSPRRHVILARTPSSTHAWTFDEAYPDVTLASLFTKQWYDGGDAREHVWQSTGGTNEFESKMGLMPLIHGTLKATLFSLLFGVPIALLAAVFTSEFLSSRVKAPIKSTVEVMAGLPSVVLGFLAALVIAPFAETHLVSILLSFALLPVAFLLGAHLWQLMPQGLALRLSTWPRFAAMALGLVLGLLAAAVLGPGVEDLLFRGAAGRGDFQAWVADPTMGEATGGWLLFMLPIAALVVFMFRARVLTPRLRRGGATWPSFRVAVVDGLLFVLGLVFTLGLAWAVAVALTSLGFDLRGGFFGTYVQRNALVVGFVMGFAIIPIIYTLAEDALSSVPSQLREGSLGAGATKWQTAMRITVPTAMSGLFSAVMIGLGRAVGETMIVLMAAGNTPIMEMNPFNGFRTLSANIAVELPEAVRGDSHYRTLFLCALVLFAMTFVVNTFAEVVRQRCRKKAVQL